MMGKPATARETYQAYLEGQVSLEEVERRIEAWNTARELRLRDSAPE